VAPEHQGKGIGTRLISEVLQDAHSRGLAVRLRVLKVNPAQRLYERLGFAVVGETETHHLMEARPLLS
jgi:ribosomal protein S18 acetylase RimI-like enzyme